MSKSNQFESDLLLHIFQNAAIALIGDATGLPAAATAGSLYVSLHTADPGDAGDQTTNEIAYTGYARVAVARSAGGWTKSGTAPTQVANAAAVNFPPCTGGSGTAGWVGIGASSSGAGKLLYSGQFSTVYFAGDGFSATDIFTAPGHTLVVGDTIVFSAVNEEALPGGLTAGTIYFVKTVSGNDITISTTSGGATLDITSAGVALVGKIATLAISNGITPSFAIGSVVIAED